MSKTVSDGGGCVCTVINEKFLRQTDL